MRQTADNQPKVSFPGGRPTFATADGKFTAALRGQLQLDTAAYFQPVGRPDRHRPAALRTGARRVGEQRRPHPRPRPEGRRRSGAAPASASTAPPTATGTIGCCSTSAARASRTPASSTRPGGSIPASARCTCGSARGRSRSGWRTRLSTNYQLFLERPAIADVARNLAAGDTRIGAGAFAYDNLWFVSGDVTGRTIGVVNTGTFITSTTVTGNVGTAQTFGDQLGFVGRRRVHAVPRLRLAREHRRARQLRRPAGQHRPDPRPTDAAGQRHGGAPARHPGAARRRHPAHRHRLDPRPQRQHDRRRVRGSEGTVPAAERSTRASTSTAPTTWPRRPSAAGTSRAAGCSPASSRAYNASTAAFDGPTIAHPFSLRDGGWGAWELAARYSDADLNFDAGALGTAPVADAIRGGDQQIWSVGLNWYPNQVFRLHVRLRPRRDRPAVAQRRRSTRRPTGAQIGQTYNVDRRAHPGRVLTRSSRPQNGDQP